MAARGLIEWRNANQAVHAAFCGKKSESVLALDAQGCGFQARAFAGRQVQHGGAKPLTLRPAEIHSHQHLGPVLRLRATGAGFDGHDGIQSVVLAGEQRERLELGDIRVGGGHFALDFAKQRIALGHVGFFLGEMKIRLDIALHARKLRIGCDNPFGKFSLLENLLRLFLVLPEIGMRGFCF